jgi:hypothetical protein
MLLVLSPESKAVGSPARGAGSRRARRQGQTPKHPPSHAHVVLQTLSPLSVAFWQQAWPALQELSPTSPVPLWHALLALQEPLPTSPVFALQATRPLQDPLPILPLLPSHTSGSGLLQELSPTLPLLL